MIKMNCMMKKYSIESLRLMTFVVLVALFSSCSTRIMQSPDKDIRVSLLNGKNGLFYNVHFHGKQVISNSQLGFVLNDQAIDYNTLIKQLGKRIINEHYKTRGFHSDALNNANEYTYQINSSNMQYVLQLRIYNDGLAFRYIFNENDSIHINRELTTFSPPKQVPVWFFERTNDWKLKSYAGIWTCTKSDSLYKVSPNGPVQGPVLVYELPVKKYMAITEAALYNYSGMRLEAKSNASLMVNFTEGEKGFTTLGKSVSPWRVVLLVDDLNQLVNSDLITSLNPAPDNVLFKDISWIKPGRSVWSWWSDPKGYMTQNLEKHYIDRAHEFGFEYILLDEGWEKWSNKWTDLKHICSYAHAKNVNVFVWKHSAQLNIPNDNYKIMSHFLDSIKSAGVSGIKIDFMNAESKSIIDFDEKALQMCADRKLLVDFHGCQKPSGEFRTYPNEITREGIRGLELNKMNQPISGNHNVALVFTRCILNNADYTPIGFSNPGETTWAHQLATGFAFTSPLLVVAENPDTLILSKKIAPMLPLIKDMPSVWDETVILPESSISSKAIMARKKGNDWYLIVLNGKYPTTLHMKTNFLGDGYWKCYGIMDDLSDLENVLKDERIIHHGEELTINVMSNGGAVFKFVKQ